MRFAVLQVPVVVSVLGPVVITLFDSGRAPAAAPANVVWNVAPAEIANDFPACTVIVLLLSFRMPVCTSRLSERLTRPRLAPSNTPAVLLTVILPKPTDVLLGRVCCAVPLKFQVISVGVGSVTAPVVTEIGVGALRLSVIALAKLSVRLAMLIAPKFQVPAPPKAAFARIAIVAGC